MFDIYDTPIGRTLPLRVRMDGASSYEMQHDWPDETRVSGGRGVVFVRGGENYATPFIEVYPPGAAFIRGEGATLADAEESAWKQYQVALHCPSGEHEWAPENRSGHRYTNGAGFCKHCGTFKSQAFTGEQLGQFCARCGTGTIWHQEPDGTWECEACRPLSSLPDMGFDEVLKRLAAE